MTGKEIIQYITDNHLEDAEVRVFSSEKWRWITAIGCMHHNSHVVQIDAKYLTNAHVQALNKQKKDPVRENRYKCNKCGEIYTGMRCWNVMGMGRWL